ncbi:hypothetical protein ABPG72_010880 [Tetrahymena utriculariae]
MNKAYIVALAYYVYYNSTYQIVVQLDIVQCSDSSLKGFYCLDFSKIPDGQLNLYRLNSRVSQMSLLVYGCQAIDQFKKKIPKNCADQTEINAINSELKQCKIETQIIQLAIQCHFFFNLKRIFDFRRLFQKTKTKITEHFSSKAKRSIENEVFKFLDISKICKDLIFLKKAVAMLLSKEQFAMIQLAGFSCFDPSQEPIKSGKINQKTDKVKGNYFEKQLQILGSDELKRKYIERFLSRFSNNSNISKVDLRII